MLTPSKFTILRVWKNATKVEGYNPDIWRKDFAGAWIRRDSYGKHTQYGWVISFLIPLSKGGTQTLDNLTALHWKNDETKSTDYPEFTTIISSDSNHNINKVKRWTFKK